MKTIRFLALIIPFLTFTSCDKDEDNHPKYQVYEAAYGKHDMETSNDFELFGQNLLTKPLPEASGIVSGRKNPALVYIHEDSGNRPVVFVYDTLGNYLGDIVLVGIQNRDWEDIAIGPGPEEGETYLYVGDIGDNSSGRPHLYIHRFPEPNLTSLVNQAPFSLEIDDFFTISYQYPDGARDAETLMIDPSNKDLIIITKREVHVHVYKLPFPHKDTEMTTAGFKGKLPFRTIVGGDISPDGKEILIKDYGNIYHWRVQNNVISTLFEQVPEKVAYIPEVQGEAVGWSFDGSGYFTTTETEKHDADPVLYHYRRK